MVTKFTTFTVTSQMTSAKHLSHYADQNIHVSIGKCSESVFYRGEAELKNVVKKFKSTCFQAYTMHFSFA